MRVQKRHLGKEKAQGLQFLRELFLLDVLKGKRDIDTCGRQSWDSLSEKLVLLGLQENFEGVTFVERSHLSLSLMHEGLQDHKANCEGLACGLGDLELKCYQGISISCSCEEEELYLVEPFSKFSRVNRELVPTAFVSIESDRMRNRRAPIEGLLFGAEELGL